MNKIIDIDEQNTEQLLSILGWRYFKMCTLPKLGTLEKPATKNTLLIQWWGEYDNIESDSQQEVSLHIPFALLSIWHSGKMTSKTSTFK